MLTVKKHLNMIRLILLMMGLGMVLMPMESLANSQKPEGELIITDAWVRLPPPQAKTTGGFMKVQNPHSMPISIVAADSKVADKTELHTHIKGEGMMKMREIPSVEIPAKSTVIFQPGSLHIMLIDLKKPLQEGEDVWLRLRLNDGSHQEINAKVRHFTPIKTQE